MQNLHPAISKLIAQSKLKTKQDVVFISVYLPKSKNLFRGISEAVKFRLAHRYTPVVLFSFHSIEILQQYDTFDILSLSGTAFVRLPFAKQELERAINNIASISETEWNSFSVNVAETLLKENAIIFKHRQEHDLVNKITFPLLNACCAVKDFPLKREEKLSVVIDKLEIVTLYVQREEITDLFFYAQIAKESKDDYVQKIIRKLEKIKELSKIGQNDLDLEKILSLINQIGEIKL